LLRAASVGLAEPLAALAQQKSLGLTVPPSILAGVTEVID
jgi:hypothetical protein